MASLDNSVHTDRSPSHGKKKKKSKLEKIYELQAQKKQLSEENKTLRREVQALKQQPPPQASASALPLPPMVPCDSSTLTSSNEEKLLEAVKSLKRVAVKQEHSLATLRSKADDKRRQLEARDQKIAELQQEVDRLRHKQQRRRSSMAASVANMDDVNQLRSQVHDLELNCTEHETRNKTLATQLEASEDEVKKLHRQFQSARGLMQSQPSQRSLRSVDTSASEYDVAKLKKELANKIERIVLLEFDLEMCKEDLHELREKHILGGAYHSDDDGEGTLDRSFYDDGDDDSDLTPDDR